MPDLKQKLATAQKDYDAARSNLEKRRSAYENGPHKDYAETQANLSELKATISENEASLGKSKDGLVVELQASRGKTTEAAKKLLRDRRDTEEVLEQCYEIEKEVQKRVSELRFPVSTAARGYEAAYSAAAECWWKVQTYSALMECGQRLCEVMAVVPVDVSYQQFDSAPLYDSELPKALIFQELDRMLKEYKGDRQPYQAELGKFDLGTFSKSEMLTPAQMQFIKKDPQAAD